MQKYYIYINEPIIRFMQIFQKFLVPVIVAVKVQYTPPSDSIDVFHNVLMTTLKDLTCIIPVLNRLRATG